MKIQRPKNLNTAHTNKLKKEKKEYELKQWKNKLNSYCIRWNYHIDDYILMKAKIMELLYKMFIVLETFQHDDEICKEILHTKYIELEGFTIQDLCNTGNIINIIYCRQFIVWMNKDRRKNG